MWSIEAIKDANRRAGKHWFEPGTMRFFASRVGSTVYQGPGGVYFVSSERFIPSRGDPTPRRYTLRRFDPATGGVETASPFNRWSRGRAIHMAKAYARMAPTT